MKTDIRKIKGELREQAKQLRRELPAAKRQRYDSAILGRLLSLPCYKSCSLVLTYVSTEIEVNTLALIDRALHDGKTVACPRCVENTRLMEFYRIRSRDDLEPGSFGVLEPRADKENLLTQFDNSICVIPGLSFDRMGFRLGYGKGYYDRFLAEYDGVRVGICYAGNLRERLPHGKFDRAVDILLTEGITRTIISRKRPAADAAAGTHGVSG